MSHFDIEKELEIMCKWKFTAEEWLFIRLLLLAQSPVSKPQYLHKYFVECHKISLPRETIKSLQERGVIDKKFEIPKNGGGFSVDDIKFSKSFVNSYFRASGKLGAELFNAYPPYLYGAGGKMLPARNLTKIGYTDRDDFYFAYGKAIRFSKEYHEKVMESLQFAKDNSLIQYGIAEYYVSRKWEEHIEMMEKDEIGDFSTKFDTIETV